MNGWADFSDAYDDDPEWVPATAEEVFWFWACVGALTLVWAVGLVLGGIYAVEWLAGR